MAETEEGEEKREVEKTAVVLYVTCLPVSL
jgi:hypothetical protein